MTRGTAFLVAAFMVSPCVSWADSVTFDIWTSRNPDTSVSCAVRLNRGQMSAVEVAGLGMPPPKPMRWYAGVEERQALDAALLAFLNGDLPVVEPYSSRLPDAPYITLNWSAQTADGFRSGLYAHPGLDLPPVLMALLDQVLPGGLCARLLDR